MLSQSVGDVPGKAKGIAHVDNSLSAYGTNARGATKLAGDTGMLAELILNKHHEVEARFCKMCFHKLESVTFRGQLFHLFFVVSIFITVLSAIYVNSVAGFENSLWVVGIGICLAIGLRVYARYYTWTSSPKITNVNKKRLVLKVPGHGKFVFERSASKLERVSEGKT